MSLESQVVGNPAPRFHCTSASHDHAKATPSIWRTWIPCGQQRVEADEFGPAEVLDLKTCPNCHSTLAVTVVQGAA